MATARRRPLTAFTFTQRINADDLDCMGMVGNAHGLTAMPQEIRNGPFAESKGREA
jgi:hypothetical protein